MRGKPQRKENFNAIRTGLLHSSEIMDLFETFKDIGKTASKITTTFNKKTTIEYINYIFYDF